MASIYLRGKKTAKKLNFLQMVLHTYWSLLSDFALWLPSFACSKSHLVPVGFGLFSHHITKRLQKALAS